MKMKKFSKKEKLLLSIALSVGLIGLLINASVGSVIGKFAGLNQEIAKKTSLLRRHSRLIKKGENIISSYDSYKENLGIEVGPDEGIVVFFEEIESTAKEFGLTIEKIRPQPIEKRKDYQKVSLEIEIAGNFSSIFKLINKIENSAAFIRISSLRLSPQGKTSSELRAKIILFKIFFKKS